MDRIDAHTMHADQIVTEIVCRYDQSVVLPASARCELVRGIAAALRDRETKIEALSKMLTAGSNKILELQLAKTS